MGVILIKPPQRTTDAAVYCEGRKGVGQMTDGDEAREAYAHAAYERNRTAWDALGDSEEKALEQIRSLMNELDKSAQGTPGYDSSRLGSLMENVIISPPKKRKTTRLEVADALISAEVETVRAEKARVLADMNHPGMDIYLAAIQGREGGLLTALRLVARALSDVEAIDDRRG
jgi:hypothetical protein